MSGQPETVPYHVYVALKSENDHIRAQRNFLLGVLRDVSLTLPMRIVPRSDSHEIVWDLLGKVRSVYEHFGSEEKPNGQASA